MSSAYYVGFSRRYHLLARAIMWFTRSNVSHAYLVQRTSAGHVYVLESTGLFTTHETASKHLAAGAKQVGINISFPSSKPPPAPPVASGDPLDVHFPGFDFTPPPPAAKKSALVPTLLIGGALATGAYFLLRK